MLNHSYSIKCVLLNQLSTPLFPRCPSLSKKGVVVQKCILLLPFCVLCRFVARQMTPNSLKRETTQSNCCLLGKPSLKSSTLYKNQVILSQKVFLKQKQSKNDLQKIIFFDRTVNCLGTSFDNHNQNVSKMKLWQCELHALHTLKKKILVLLHVQN